MHPVNCVYTSEMQVLRHKMQHKHQRHKLNEHNCACGLYVLAHNKYAVHSAPSAQKGADSDIVCPGKKLWFLTHLECTSGLTGTKTMLPEIGLPLVCFFHTHRIFHITPSFELPTPNFVCSSNMQRVGAIRLHFSACICTYSHYSHMRTAG